MRLTEDEYTPYEQVIHVQCKGHNCFPHDVLTVVKRTSNFHGPGTRHGTRLRGANIRLGIKVLFAWANDNGFDDIDYLHTWIKARLICYGLILKASFTWWTWTGRKGAGLCTFTRLLLLEALLSEKYLNMKTSGWKKLAWRFVIGLKA